MGATLVERAPVRPDPRRLQQSPACLPTAGCRTADPRTPAASPRRTSSSTAPPGPRSPGRRRARSAPRRSAALRGLGDALDLEEVAGGLPAALPAAQPVRRGGRQPAPAPGGLPAPAHPAAHAVRDRPGRLGGGRQVHHRPRAAADAGALARAPQRRAGDHRRLPLPQRRARAPRPAAAQGLPGVLRPPGAAALRRRHQVRQGRGRGADVLPPRLRRGARREGRRQAPRHRHHRGPQRPPAGAGARGRPHRPDAERLLRLQRVRRRRHRPHPATGTSSASCGCARPRSATRSPTSPSTARSASRRRPPRRSGSGTPSTGPTCARTCCPPAPAPPWCCARTATTRCATCGSASSEPARAPAGTTPPAPGAPGTGGRRAREVAGSGADALHGHGDVAAGGLGVRAHLVGGLDELLRRARRRRRGWWRRCPR